MYNRVKKSAGITVATFLSIVLIAVGVFSAFQVIAFANNTNLQAPQNFRVSFFSDSTRNTVILKWNTVQGADAYTVKIYRTSDCTGIPFNHTPTDRIVETNVVIEYPPHRQIIAHYPITRSYHVAPIAEDSTVGQYSVCKKVILQAPEVTVPTNITLQAPQNLRASVLSNSTRNTVTLNWNTVQDADAYTVKIYRTSSCTGTPFNYAPASRVTRTNAVIEYPPHRQIIAHYPITRSYHVAAIATDGTVGRYSACREVILRSPESPESLGLPESPARPGAGQTGRNTTTNQQAGLPAAPMHFNASAEASEWGNTVTLSWLVPRYEIMLYENGVCAGRGNKSRYDITTTMPKKLRAIKKIRYRYSEYRHSYPYPTQVSYRIRMIHPVESRYSDCKSTTLTPQ